MIQLGKEQDLKVLRITSIGAYLGEERDPLAIFARESTGNTASITDKTDILLPKNEIKGLIEVGETIRAYVYLDSEDRPVATLHSPALSIGTIAPLTVKDVGKIGAFLDWGLPKDLFLPYKEQNGRVKPGDRVLVTLYVDKSKRLCATMRLYKHLRLDSEYKAGDRVKGMVYEVSDRFGAYIAVDNLFSALIPTKELMRSVKVGDELELRVSRVLPDGKLELSMREPAHLQIMSDCDTILAKLRESYVGYLPFSDSSDAEEIKREFGMSKNSFKRAIGHLMKEGRIEIGENGIRLK